MIHQFKGVYRFTRGVLDDWNSSVIGVYYLGAMTTAGKLRTYYIGSGTGEGGIKDRLYDHLGKWKDVTHFGYEKCDTKSETLAHEKSEIKKYKPKHNDQLT